MLYASANILIISLIIINKRVLCDSDRKLFTNYHLKSIEVMHEFYDLFDFASCSVMKISLLH